MSAVIAAVVYRGPDGEQTHRLPVLAGHSAQDVSLRLAIRVGATAWRGGVLSLKSADGLRKLEAEENVFSLLSAAASSEEARLVFEAGDDEAPPMQLLRAPGEAAGRRLERGD